MGRLQVQQSPQACYERLVGLGDKGSLGGYE